MVGRSDGAPVLTLGTADVGAAYRFPGGIGALLLDQDGDPILLRQTLDEDQP